jgi:hypothetical protein
MDGAGMSGGGWIKTSERAPQDGYAVLVFRGCNDGCNDYQLRWIYTDANGEKRWLTDAGASMPLSAFPRWQALPMPPRLYLAEFHHMNPRSFAN